MSRSTKNVSQPLTRHHMKPVTEVALSQTRYYLKPVTEVALSLLFVFYCNVLRMFG